VFSWQQIQANEAKGPRLQQLPLLDLGFLELDVLAGDRIIFLERQLFCLGAGVLLRHIEIAGVRGGQKLDLDHRGLGHRFIPSLRRSAHGVHAARGPGQACKE
jgi:hypothetical protein